MTNIPGFLMQSHNYDCIDHLPLLTEISSGPSEWMYLISCYVVNKLLFKIVQNLVQLHKTKPVEWGCIMESIVKTLKTRWHSPFVIYCWNIIDDECDCICMHCNCWRVYFCARVYDLTVEKLRSNCKWWYFFVSFGYAYAWEKLIK